MGGQVRSTFGVNKQTRTLNITLAEHEIITYGDELGKKCNGPYPNLWAIARENKTSLQVDANANVAHISTPLLDPTSTAEGFKFLVVGRNNPDEAAVLVRLADGVEFQIYHADDSSHT